MRLKAELTENGSDLLDIDHIAEAISYRKLDRSTWGL